MKHLTTQLRQLRYVLIYLGMLSLVLAGGSFTHSHEMPIASKHLTTHSHADSNGEDGHCHDCAPVKSDGSVHCGAQILALISIPDTPVHRPKMGHCSMHQSDLIAFAFAPDPPPPRLA